MTNECGKETPARRDGWARGTIRGSMRQGARHANGRGPSLAPETCKLNAGAGLGASSLPAGAVQ